MDFERDIIRCLETLRGGGTILYPTDTIWGIGCDATNLSAVKKIYKLKRRSESKSLIVLLADTREINRYVSRPEPYIFDYLQSTARPTTVIYEGAIGLAENLIAADGSIAIRIVKENFCRHLIKRFRLPLVSSSANISGEDPPRFFSEISEEILEGVDYVVQYRQSDKTASEASSVVRFNNRGEIIVLRK